MQSRLEPIDWLRGIAASWVLVYHCNIVIQKGKYFAAPSLGVLAEAGHRGVDLFFVLSGFIMFATFRISPGGRLMGTRNFLIRRFFRIFPIYWITLAALVGAGAALAMPALEGTGYNVLANIFLLPRDDLTTYVPVVAWTLTHELMFYLVFSTAYLSRWLCGSLLLAWAMVAIYSYFHMPPPGWQMQTSLLNCYFLVGIGAAILAPRVRNQPGLTIFAGLMLLVFAIALEPPGEVVKADLSLKMLCYALGFAGLIMGISQLDVAQRQPWHTPLRVLGRQSYSLYLLHYPIVIVFALVLSRLGLPYWLLLPLAFAASFVASWIAYRLVEAPAVNLGRRLSRTAG